MKKLLGKISRKLRLRFRPTMLSNVPINGVIPENFRLGSHTTIIREEGLNLERNVFIGQYNFIEATNGIKISEGCQLTNFISVLTHSSHISIRLHGENYTQIDNPVGYNKGSVEIGKYSFIGPNTVIMPNTTIGKGCIVSSHSVLQGNYPDFSVIKGNPAKIVGDSRKFDERYLRNNPELEDSYNKWAKD